MNVIVQHIPHAIPVVAIWGIMLRFWLIQRRLVHGAQSPAAAAAPPQVHASSAVIPVRRTVAVRGLLALGPLLGALGTGLVIYALNLGSGHPGATAIWTHVGISLLAMLLVGYKIAEVGWSTLRQSITRRQAVRSGSSLVLLVLWVPLLASGIALLVAPSQASFTAYAHLIASVWWTGLLLWHLRRYLARASRAVLARPTRTPEPRPAAAVFTRPAGQPRAPRRPSAQDTGTRRRQDLSIAESETAGMTSEEAPAASLQGS